VTSREHGVLVRPRTGWREEQLQGQTVRPKRRLRQCFDEAAEVGHPDAYPDGTQILGTAGFKRWVALHQGV
jgi:hypothetical protein